MDQGLEKRKEEEAKENLGFEELGAKLKLKLVDSRPRGKGIDFLSSIKL